MRPRCQIYTQLGRSDARDGGVGGGSSDHLLAVKMLLGLLLALVSWQHAVARKLPPSENSFGVSIRQTIKTTTTIVFGTVKTAAYVTVDGMISAPAAVDKVRRSLKRAYQNNDSDDDAFPNMKVPLTTSISTRVSAKKAIKSIENPLQEITSRELNLLERAKNVINSFYRFSDSIENKLNGNKFISSNEVKRYKNNYAKYNLQDYTIVPTELDRMIDDDIESTKDKFFTLTDSLLTFALAFSSALKTIAALPEEVQKKQEKITASFQLAKEATKVKQQQARDLYEVFVKIVTLQAAKESFERLQFAFNERKQRVIKARDNTVGIIVSAQSAFSKLSSGVNSLSKLTQEKKPAVIVAHESNRINAANTMPNDDITSKLVMADFVSTDNAPDVSTQIIIAPVDIQPAESLSVVTEIKAVPDSNDQS